MCKECATHRENAQQGKLPEMIGEKRLLKSVTSLMSGSSLDMTQRNRSSMSLRGEDVSPAAVRKVLNGRVYALGAICSTIRSAARIH